MKAVLILLFAISVNFGMFLIMDGMVTRDRVRVVDLMDAQLIEFVRTPMEEETRTKDRRSAPPPKPQEIERPRAQVTNIAERASALPTFSSAYEITSLLGEGAGVSIGQALIGNQGVNDLGIMMANDLIPLSMLPPQYPPNARARNVEGWVDVVFSIDTRGLVDDAWVVDSEPPEIFDRAATDATMRWRFRPMEEDGEPVAALRRIRVNFSLEQNRI